MCHVNINKLETLINFNTGGGPEKHAGGGREPTMQFCSGLNNAYYDNQ